MVVHNIIYFFDKNFDYTFRQTNCTMPATRYNLEYIQEHKNVKRLAQKIILDFLRKPAIPCPA